MHTLVQQATATFLLAADAERASGMEAYMRGQFPFYGIPSPLRKQLSRPLLSASLAREEELEQVLRELWALPHQELQYFAIDLAMKHHGLWRPETLSLFGLMITEKSWWDTVDGLAGHAVGDLLRRFPQLQSGMDQSAIDENLWLNRTALLFQLRYKAATDEERLFRFCRSLAPRPEFFLRKAIGWALRQYSTRGRTASESSSRAALSSLR